MKQDEVRTFEKCDFKNESNADCKKYWKSYFKNDLKKTAEKRMKLVSNDWAIRDGFDRGFKAGIKCMLEIIEDEFR